MVLFQIAPSRYLYRAFGAKRNVQKACCVREARCRLAVTTVMASHDLSSMDYGEEEIDKALWEVGFRRDLRKQQREIINDVQSKPAPLLKCYF